VIDVYYIYDNVFDFFFFQAEDGIRDLYVTGVQTCALPISATCKSRTRQTTLWFSVRFHDRLLKNSNLVTVAALREAQARQRAARSEERRVGKECRSRWSPDH